jgi:hypothetical protein
MYKWLVISRFDDTSWSFETEEEARAAAKLIATATKSDFVLAEIKGLIGPVRDEKTLEVDWRNE